jgi:hypothetical protein
MSRSLPRLLVIAAMLACVAIATATAAGRRAQCRALCGDAVRRCRVTGGRAHFCRRLVRAECRHDGPDVACWPNYTGTWTFTATSEVADECGLAAGNDPTRLIRMAVRDGDDVVVADFPAGGERVFGYLRPDGSTILEGGMTLGGCRLDAEILIARSPSLPRYAANGSIRAGGRCGGRICEFAVSGRWDWQPVTSSRSEKAP